METGLVGGVVSFVVPTLNRGVYVVRAVRSALAAATGEWDVEVVVLDSKSDDGSWEALTAEFGADPRVKLLQNERGVGIVRSWIDGAEQVSGDYVTFLWSDDWVYPDFIAALMPALQAGAPSSRGHGEIRDIDESVPSMRSAETPPRASLISKADALLARFDLAGLGKEAVPVSTACALVTRVVWDEWVASVAVVSTSNPLREVLVWRRAFGPDAYVYLLAHEATDDAVGFVDAYVAQFSAHPGSITLGTEEWTRHVGHWLTRGISLQSGRLLRGLSVDARKAVYSAHLSRGLAFLTRRPPESVSSAISPGESRRWLRWELRETWRVARQDIGGFPAIGGLAASVTSKAMRHARGVLGSRVK